MHSEDVFFNCQADTFNCMPKDFASSTCIAEDNVKFSAAAHKHLERTSAALGEVEAQH